MRAFLAACLVLLTAYLAFYARYDSWAGDFAWGDRYISSTVELTSLVAIPILLRYWKQLPRSIGYFAIIITATSVAIQCASVAFWLPLEIYQMETFGHHTWVVLLRFKNIAAFALGRSEAWGLNTPSIYQDPGRRPPYHVELPALLAPSHWCCAALDCACAFWRVVWPGADVSFPVSKAPEHPLRPGDFGR